jgi:hypothetical protein
MYLLAQVYYACHFLLIQFCCATLCNEWFRVNDGMITHIFVWLIVDAVVC